MFIWNWSIFFENMEFLLIKRNQIDLRRNEELTRNVILKYIYNKYI